MDAQSPAPAFNGDDCTVTKLVELWICEATMTLADTLKGFQSKEPGVTKDEMEMIQDWVKMNAFDNIGQIPFLVTLLRGCCHISGQLHSKQLSRRNQEK